MATITVTITDAGRQAVADMLKTGQSFRVDNFAIGSGGHDTLNPTVALTPDPTWTDVPSLTFGPEPIDSTSLANPKCPLFTCRVEALEGVGDVSAVGLYGTYVYPAAVGYVVLVAKAAAGAADTLTIDDGINTPTVFELDKAGDGVTGGNVQVDISGATSADDIKTLLIAAINSAPSLAVTAASSGTGELSVTLNQTGGDAPSLSKTGAHSVTDFSGGAAGTFLFAVGTFPLSVKTDVETLIFELQPKF